MIDYLICIIQNGIINPMQAKVECNAGKFKKYYDNKIMYDELYFDIVPIMQHSDLSHLTI